MNENEIREKIRQRLKDGSLPSKPPQAQPGKKGQEFIAVSTNKEIPCTACDAPNPNLKIPFNEGERWFHRRCQEIWEEERPKP